MAAAEPWLSRAWRGGSVAVAAIGRGAPLDGGLCSSDEGRRTADSGSGNVARKIRPPLAALFDNVIAAAARSANDATTGAPARAVAGPHRAGRVCDGVDGAGDEARMSRHGAGMPVAPGRSAGTTSVESVATGEGVAASGAVAAGGGTVFWDPEHLLLVLVSEGGACGKRTRDSVGAAEWASEVDLDGERT